MRVAARELWRRPGRFALAGGAIALLSVLLLLLGGLLDGLFLGSTGAMRAQDADVFVYSSDAQESFVRSRISPELRAEVEEVEGVDRTSGLGVALVAGSDGAPDGSDDLLDLAVIGYESSTDVLPTPPGTGEGYADRSLKARGVDEGDVVAVGPTGVEVEVVGFVEDTDYLLQGSLWVTAETWREVQSSSRPDAAVGPGVFQVVLAHGDGSVTAEELATDIDESTGGATTSLTREEAVFSLPGTREQNSTFGVLIGTGFLVVGLITALFFVLLTIERTRLFAAVKALGTPSSRLVAWSTFQATAVSAGSFLLGVIVTVPLAAVVPDAIPLRLEPGARSRRVSCCSPRPPWEASSPSVASSGSTPPAQSPRRTMTALELHDVRKVYPSGDSEVVALHDATLEVGGCELVALVGPSGSGKSTLLSIAGGLLTPTSGSVVVSGEEITGYSLKELTAFRRRHVGFVFQSVNLVPFLTAYENVMIVPDLTGSNDRDVRARAEQLLEELGLRERRDNRAGDLSGGERQRVAIGRALINRPQLVLFDEPTSALDTELGEQVMGLIRREIHDRSIAGIMVTHDRRMTEYCDRTLEISDGQLAAARIVDSTTAQRSSPQGSGMSTGLSTPPST